MGSLILGWGTRTVPDILERGTCHSMCAWVRGQLCGVCPSLCVFQGFELRLQASTQQALLSTEQSLRKKYLYVHLYT